MSTVGSVFQKSHSPPSTASTAISSSADGGSRCGRRSLLQRHDIRSTTTARPLRGRCRRAGVHTAGGVVVWGLLLFDVGVRLVVGTPRTSSSHPHRHTGSKSGGGASTVNPSKLRGILKEPPPHNLHQHRVNWCMNLNQQKAATQMQHTRQSGDVREGAVDDCCLLGDD